MISGRTFSFRFLLALLGLAAVFTASSAYAQREKLSPEDLAIVNQKWPNAKKTITGLRFVITEPGTGETAASGDLVSVLYKGSLINGTVFNEVLDKASPFTFRLGRGNVIDGWDQGLRFMREGSKMTLIVPFELGYGTRGNPPAVPRQATLIFEIEMLKIEKAAPSTAPEPAPKDKKK